MFGFLWWPKSQRDRNSNLLSRGWHPLLFPSSDGQCSLINLIQKQIVLPFLYFPSRDCRLGPTARKWREDLIFGNWISVPSFRPEEEKSLKSSKWIWFWSDIFATEFSNFKVLDLFKLSPTWLLWLTSHRSISIQISRQFLKMLNILLELAFPCPSTPPPPSRSGYPS